MRRRERTFPFNIHPVCLVALVHNQTDITQVSCNVSYFKIIYLISIKNRKRLGAGRHANEIKLDLEAFIVNL